MNDHGKNSTTASLILICDTNVLLKMALFKRTLMFEAEYRWGKIAVPKSIVNELRRWLKKPGHRKVKKFGKEIIEDTIKRCSGLYKVIAEVPEEIFEKRDRTIESMAKGLAIEQKGDDPSDEDRELMVLAVENNANLASDEKLHHSLSHCLAVGREVCSFGMLVKDLFDQNKISKEDVQVGWSVLEYHNEGVRRDDRSILFDITKENPSKNK